MKKSTKPKEFKVTITIRDERQKEPQCCSVANSDLYYEQVERGLEYGRMCKEYN